MEVSKDFLALPECLTRQKMHAVRDCGSHTSALACMCVGCCFGRMVLGGVVCPCMLGLEGAICGGIYGGHITEKVIDTIIRERHLAPVSTGNQIKRK